MAAQNVSQGILNRLLTSMSIPAFPQLNISAPYLGKGGIVWRPQGKSTLQLPTMTGLAMSPEPYMEVSVDVYLLKSQYLCELWLEQVEFNTLLGDSVFRSDSPTIGSRTLQNAAILEPHDITANGQVVEVMFSLVGAWQINSNLYGGNGVQGAVGGIVNQILNH